MRLKAFILSGLCLATWIALCDSLTLAWQPSNRAVGYRIYVGGSTRSYTNVLDAGPRVEIAVSGLDLARGTYCFAASAYDAAGLESDFSTEVSWTPADWSGYTNWPGPLSLAISLPMISSAVIRGEDHLLWGSTNSTDWKLLGTMPVIAAVPITNLPAHYFFKSSRSTNREKLTITVSH